MPIIVQKFGGSSVADSRKILAAARKAIRAQKEGNQVVMVVSAMGKNTDVLIDLAKQITDEPPAREMDMLLSTGEQVSVALMAMAIHSLGHKAISLTGAQIGIITDSIHTKARIRSISTERMRKALDEGNVVIAAGFQGIDESNNITTLGRGGSDTTAVALAAVLHADSCEIYTDVDGVYTTDPRIVPEARQVRQISYDEMLELATAGAGVMHNRSIEFAKKFGVPIHVRSSFSDNPGTMIVREPEAPDVPVCGAALAKHEARVTVLGVPDRPGAALSIFSKVAAKNVAIDMIVQNEAADGRADLSFTVPRDDLPATLRAVDEAVKELGAEGCTCDEDVSTISVVGLGMATQPGVAGTMFRALAAKGINIAMITTSEIKISALVAREHAQDALRRTRSVSPRRRPIGRRRAIERTPQGFPRQCRRLAGPAAAHGKTLYRGHRPRPVAVASDVRRPARPAGLGRQDVRPARRRRHHRRHDRAEHRPRETGEHLRHRAPRRPAQNPGRGLRSGQIARLHAADALRESREALGARRRRQEPHRRRRPNVPVVGRGGHQR